MAGLQLRGDTYRISFRYQGKQHFFPIGQVSTEEAEAKVSQVEYLLMRLKQRLVALPPDVTIVEFLQFDGRVEAIPPERLTLASLRDSYLKTHRASLEPITVASIELHFRHLVGTLGDRFPIGELALADLQRYVDHRAETTTRGAQKLAPATIRKELVSLRTAWNWAVRMKMVNGKFPNAGLRFPKATAKAPFQTLAEIGRLLATNRSDISRERLYETLYLQLDETAEMLEFVKTNAGHSFIYPMFCCAAHTGARRSELIRLRVVDVDLESKSLTIHEKKRVRGTVTTRRVPLSAFLVNVLTNWLKCHPGGTWLFCHRSTVVRSRTRSQKTGYSSGKSRPKTIAERKAQLRDRGTIDMAPITKDEANHHFRQTLANSKWQVIRGWHTLRHSFVSACASRGVDQRLVEAWAGHMSPEMSRRYAHLYPSAQQKAIASVFDATDE